MGLQRRSSIYLQGRPRQYLVESFYWIQFEHFLPSNDKTYNYTQKNTTQIGNLHFVYNVGSWPDYLAEMAGILPRMVQPLSVCLRNDTFRSRTGLRTCVCFIHRQPTTEAS